MKYFLVVIVALSIDAFQALLELGVIAAFTVAPGTILGAAGGCAMANAVVSGTCAVGAALGGVGGALADFFSLHATAAIGAPVGAMVGTILDICISLTFGTGLIFMLMFTGLFSFKDLLSFRNTPFAVGKLMPFVSALPLYTAMTVMCILSKEADEKKAAGILAFATQKSAGIRTVAAAGARLNPALAATMAQAGRTAPAAAQPAARAPMQDIRTRTQPA